MRGKRLKMNKRSNLCDAFKLCAAICILGSLAIVGCKESDVSYVPEAFEGLESDSNAMSDAEYDAMVRQILEGRPAPTAAAPGAFNFSAAATTGAAPAFNFSAAATTGAAPAFNFNAAAGTGDAPATFNFNAAAGTGDAPQAFHFNSAAAATTGDAPAASLSR